MPSNQSKSAKATTEKNTTSKGASEISSGDSPIKVLLFILSIIALHIALFVQYKNTHKLDMSIMQSAPAHVDTLLADLKTESGKGKLLTVRFDGGQSITEPGVQLAKADTQSPPTLSRPSLSPSKSYTALCLDLDPPFPSFPLAGPIAHWIQPSLTASPSGDLSASVPPIAHYRGPGPPPISAPHRYVFVLYEEPEGFDVAGLRFYEKGEDGGEGRGKEREITMWERVRFDLAGWEEKAGLGGGRVVAGNVFVCNR